MSERRQMLPGNPAGSPGSPSARSAGLLSTIKNALYMTWQSPRKMAGAVKTDNAETMLVDTDDESQTMSLITKTESFVTVAAQSSQEYEASWAGLSVDDLEEVAANVERETASWVVSPIVSRERSGTSLGKRPRSDSTDASPVRKKPNFGEVDENPFVMKSVHDENTRLHVIIAQPPEALKCDIEGLAWGVQWEIARLVSADLMTYMDIMPHVDHLKDSNGQEQAASKVLPLLQPILADTTESRSNSAEERGRKPPWSELYREEIARDGDPLSGLGFSHPGWYGGQVQFTAKIQVREKSGKSTSGEPYKVVLQRPELGPSNRFGRRFGSRRFIRVQIPKAILGSRNNSLTEYFQRPFLLSGHLFRAFFAKERNVFLVETDDPVSGVFPTRKSGLEKRYAKFLDFLLFHNPIELNMNQATAKWSARFALGLSNSVPGICLRPENIHYIEDIVAPFVGEKPPPEKIMTDGCGWINVHGLRMLQAKLQWDKLPSAVQFRLGGAKGLLLLHPDGKYGLGPEEPHVWLRPSQIKILYDDNADADPTRLVIDILRPSRFKHPARLSAETIVNIVHNQSHVSAKERHQALRRLMHDGLNETLRGLVQWAKPTLHTPNEVKCQAIPLLWHEVSRAGGVMGSRMAREFTGSARARGFISRWDEEEEEEEEEAPINHADKELRPQRLEEKAMRLLDAGFEPHKSKFLNDKLKYVVKKVTSKYTQRYKIDVPGSVEVFCVPDPLGVLEPGEVYLRTSEPIKGLNGAEVDIIIGDVLVARNPTKVPTDVQKVRAVYRPELHQYPDVLVVSTKGDRSLASLLAGGDYDGDTVLAILERSLVERFVNADISFADPPEDLESNFEREANETVQEFQGRTAHLSHDARITELQTGLLSSLRDVFTVGSYSVWHDNAVYSLGYDHPETKRLAFMFCSCLDGAKSGLHVKSSVFKADKQKWDRRGPSWKETEEPLSHDKPLVRGHHLGPFIMDDLQELGKELSVRVIKQWEKYAPQDTRDEDLLQPWIDAQSRAEKALALGCQQYGDELKKIASHVQRVRDTCLETWRRQLSPTKTPPLASPTSRRPSRSKNPLAKANREIRVQFSKGPKDLLFFTDTHREELKASYAYMLDTQRTPFSSFAFSIALCEITNIKARAAGGVTVIPKFHGCFDIQSGVKSLSKVASR